MFTYEIRIENELTNNAVLESELRELGYRTFHVKNRDFKKH